MQKQFYTIKDICELTGKSYMTVRSWIVNGRVPATKIDEEWLVHIPAFNRVFGIEEATNETTNA